MKPLPIIRLVILLAFPPAAANADVVINEFMSSNGSTLADEDGDFEDWIELHNPTTEAIDLGGWALSDNPGAPKKWTFLPQTFIEPGGHLLVRASGKNRTGLEDSPPPPEGVEPHEFPGLVAWFRADALNVAHGDPIESWTDSSGSGNHASQPNSGLQPLMQTNAINGLPALAFGGERQFSLPQAGFNGMDNLANFTFVAVTRWDGGVVSGLWGTGPSNATSGNLHFEITSGGGLRLRVAGMHSLRSPGAVATGWRMLAALQDSTFEDPVSRTFVDGKLAGIRSEETGNSPLTGYGGYFLGNSHDSERNFDGLIAEVAIFNRALDSTELAALHAHLTTKYDLEAPPAYSGVPLHTNFSISADGEALVLTRPDGTIADFIPPVALPRDTSYGRQPDGAPDFHHFLEPTPGAANTSQTYTAPVPPPDFSVQRGFHTDGFDLTLSHPDPDVEIYFRTDGSVPAPGSGTLFTSPISVNSSSVIRAYAHKDGALPTSKVVTHSYLFPDDIVLQRDDPTALGFPEAWGTWTATHYGFEPEVSEAPAYAPLMKQALTDIPTISLVMEMDDLFDPDDGIYASRSRAGGAPRGEAWERPVSVEILHPDGALDHFQINAGIRCQGGASRRADRTPKSSFRLLFKNIYETGTLQYPLLGDEGNTATEFNTLILRAEYNNEWLHGFDASQRRRGQYVRDQFIRHSQLAMHGHGSRSKHLHLYLNGVYWGLYSPSERPDAAFGSTYFGGEREDWDAMSHRGVRDGNGVAWNTLNTRANADLSIQENYEAVLEYIDLPQYIDYMIVNLWAGMQDWPFNNWNAIRRREEGNGFMFFCWDSERSMESVNVNRVVVNQDAARFYDRMRANPEFRLAFADRVQKHFFNEGALTPAQTIARYQAAAAIIETAVIAESARWGSFRRDKGTAGGSETEIFTKNIHWDTEYNNLVNTYLPQRTGIVLQQFRNANLYPSLDAPGMAVIGSEVRISSPAPFHFTTDGSDPRMAGGAINPSATMAGNMRGVYRAAVPVHHAAGIRARAYAGGEWSALADGSLLAGLPEPVRIHRWEFENADTFLHPDQTVGGGAVLSSVHGPATEVVRHANAVQGFDSAHLRVNNPLGATLTWAMPTTGFGGITLAWETRRSGQGAGLQILETTADGLNWSPLETYAVFDADPQYHNFDLTSLDGVADNPHFAVRVTFAQGDGGTEGNNRFDNVTLTGIALPGGEPPASVEFDTVPPSTQSGSVLSPVVVRLLDADGNPAIAYNGPVTLTLSGIGNLTGTLTIDAVNGTATFDDLILTGAGLLQLVASVDELDTATSPGIRVVTLTELLVPQFIQGEQDATNDNFDRVPFAWLARIDGLAANATYRFGNRITLPTDTATNDGAGNMIFVTSPTENWIRTTASPRFRPGDLGTRHFTFTTDAEGSFTGWFITEPSGNARFTPGNTVHLRLLLNDGNDGEETAHILTTTDSSQVLRFGTAAGDGSAIIGESFAAARRLVVLYSDADGNTRPLAATPVEITGAEVDSRYAEFYQNSVVTNQSHWGTILPNTLPGGLRRIEIRDSVGAATLLDTRISSAGFPGTIDSVGSLDIPIVLDGTPTAYGQWRNLHFPDPAERADDAISGPSATDADGTANLFRYAFNLGTNEPVAPFMPSIDAAGEAFRFVHDPEKPDLAWVVSASQDLADWSETLFDSRQDASPAAGPDGSTSIAYPADRPRLFLRLELLLVD